MFALGLVEQGFLAGTERPPCNLTSVWPRVLPLTLRVVLAHCSEPGAASCTTRIHGATDNFPTAAHCRTRPDFRLEHSQDANLNNRFGEHH
jgi:hypothetical protein